MEKLTLKEACKIFRKCRAISTTECESCILTKIEDIGFMELTAEDVVRNQLVKKIVKAYENEKE